jgi:hypothetical protein
MLIAQWYYMSRAHLSVVAAAHRANVARSCSCRAARSRPCWLGATRTRVGKACTCRRWAAGAAYTPISPVGRPQMAQVPRTIPSPFSSVTQRSRCTTGTSTLHRAHQHRIGPPPLLFPCPAGSRQGGRGPHEKTLGEPPRAQVLVTSPTFALPTRLADGFGRKVALLAVARFTPN